MGGNLHTKEKWMAIFTPKGNGWKFAQEWRIGGNLLTKEEVAICSLKKNR